MKPILMVDLKGQYENCKAEIDQAIQSVINNATFINGNEVTHFKNELAHYLGSKYVIPCANGTDAIQIALMALDLQAGDEIITTNFTFIATVEAITLLGLVPVLVDVDPLSFTINPTLLKNAITPKTKAILPVHLFGQCADMETIMSIAKTYNLLVIEDNAQSIGAHFSFSSGLVKQAGTMGVIGCFSFFPSKNLGCYGDGGAVCTDNDEVAEKLQMIVNHGSKKKYYHEIIGVNSRLDTIQAAILRVKLHSLHQYIDARQKAAEYYNSLLSKITHIDTPQRNLQSTHVYHQYTITVKKGENKQLQAFLQSKNIPSMIYYPVPMHKQKAFENIVKLSGSYHVSDALCTQVLSLPMHTELSYEQISYICSAIHEYFKI